MIRSVGSVRWALALAGAAVLLCAAALINGGAILYPDTGSYIIDGERIVHLTTPLNVRPVFYGVAIWFLHWDRTLWPVLLAQGVIVAHLVMLTLRGAGAAPGPLTLLGVIAGLVVLTPVSWYVSHVLPDIFAAVLILCLFLLGFCRDRLTRAETVYLVLLGCGAASFHLTHVLTGLALVAATALIWVVWRPERRHISPLLALAPVALALAGSLAFSLVEYHRLTLAPNSPPHVMARLIADGPGRDYLREACPTRPLEICRYLDQLPPTEDGILWGLLPSIPVADGKLIREQQGEVVSGTIKTRPLQVIGHMLLNTARQALTIRSTTQFQPGDWQGLRTSNPFYLHELEHTLQAQDRLDGPVLAGINRVHALAAVAGLLGGFAAAAACIIRHRYRAPALLGIISLGLLANAFASGAFSGVFDRYQGRVVWLLPLGAVAAGLAMARNRTTTSIRES